MSEFIRNENNLPFKDDGELIGNFVLHEKFMS